MTTVQTKPDVDTVRVADLLDLVRKHAVAEDWCEDVESYLGFLGLEFEPSGCQCCDFCRRDSCDFCRRDSKVSGLAERFTLVAGAPQTVTKAALKDLVAKLDREVPATSEDIRAEAAELFGLAVAR